MNESESLWNKALAEFNEVRKQAGKPRIIPKRNTDNYVKVINLMKEIAKREPKTIKPCLII